MDSTKPIFPAIADSERTPLIDLLLEVTQWQEQRIADLEDEIQHRLMPLNEQHKNALEWVRGQIGKLYADLKAYKEALDEAQKERIKNDFSHLCQTETSYATLNQLLTRTQKNQAEWRIAVNNCKSRTYE